METILNLIFLVAGIIGLIVTIILAVMKKKTLSQRAQELAPRKIDWVIGVVGWIVLCFLPLDKSLAIFWAGFWGHIWIANKERYAG